MKGYKPNLTPNKDGIETNAANTSFIELGVKMQHKEDCNCDECEDKK